MAPQPVLLPCTSCPCRFPLEAWPEPVAKGELLEGRAFQSHGNCGVFRRHNRGGGPLV